MKNIKLLFKSLVNNGACIEGGRERNWIYALVFFILSIGLAIMPTMIQSGSAYGASFLTDSFNGALDVAMVDFGMELQNTVLHDPIELAFVDYGNGTVLIDKKVEEPTLQTAATWGDVFTDYTYAPYAHHRTINVIDGEVIGAMPITITDFNVYYIGVDNATLSKYATNIIAGRQPTIDATEGIESVKNTTSFLILGKNIFYTYLYPNVVDPVPVTYTGDYLNTPLGSFNNLFTVTLSDQTVLTPATWLSELSATAHKDSFTAYQQGVYENFVKLYNDGYKSSKGRKFAVDTLIPLVLYTTLYVLSIVILFVMTRGKNNPYRFFSFWDVTKIASWALFSPAVLTMIISFIFPSFAIFAFVILFGIRFLWMSLKNLKH
jgi:hypothetical protein